MIRTTIVIPTIIRIVSSRMTTEWCWDTSNRNLRLVTNRLLQFHQEGGVSQGQQVVGLLCTQAI